jgi:hypothetical protein
MSYVLINRTRSRLSADEPSQQAAAETLKTECHGTWASRDGAEISDLLGLPGPARVRIPNSPLGSRAMGNKNRILSESRRFSLALSIQRSPERYTRVPPAVDGVSC